MPILEPVSVEFTITAHIYKLAAIDNNICAGNINAIAAIILKDGIRNSALNPIAVKTIRTIIAECCLANAKLGVFNVQAIVALGAINNAVGYLHVGAIEG